MDNIKDNLQKQKEESMKLAMESYHSTESHNQKSKYLEYKLICS